jgi:hypothetical protein
VFAVNGKSLGCSIIVSVKSISYRSLAIVTLILINKIYLAQLKNLHKKVNKADEFINE